MRTRTRSRLLAALAGAALVLTGCTSGSSGRRGSSSPASADITFSWGYEQQFTSYNPNTSEGSSNANAVVLNQVLRGFWYLAPDGSIAPDHAFGTYQKVSDDPLTVTYAINPKAVWSDGVPISCDDIVLTWLANSGVTGAHGFDAAATTGYDLMDPPQCAVGDRTFTIVYKKPFADWKAMFGGGPSILPAHVVERQARMAKTFVDYTDDPTSPALAKAIDFYNKGWSFKPGHLNKRLIPSSGPYLISSWVAGQSLTLKANPRWWSRPPKAGTIVLRYMSGQAMAQALQNGEIQAMDPQPQVDIVNELKSLGSQIKYWPEVQYSFEHLDFNFKAEFADPRLRQAFALCVPRAQIVDNLIKPEQADAQIMESRFIFPFQPQYRRYLSGLGASQYDSTDIPAARVLLQQAGKLGLTVRVGWEKDPAALNKRRADTLALLQASCDQAGFRVIDGGTPDFFRNAWPAGQWDVAMFAWAGSPLVTGSDGIYDTGGEENPGGFSDKQADALIAELDVELDPAKQLDLRKQLDTLLWTDLATIPLFAFPGILATTTNAEGVVYNATQADLSWNAYDWNLKR